MSRRKRKTFFLVICDHVAGFFTVEGPMTDARPWNHAVTVAEEQGLRITCSAEQWASADEAASEFLRASPGWRRLSPGSIVRPRRAGMTRGARITAIVPDDLHHQRRAGAGLPWKR